MSRPRVCARCRHTLLRAGRWWVHRSDHEWGECPCVLAGVNCEPG